MPTIIQVQQIIQQGDYAYSIDLHDACLHIPIVQHHHQHHQYLHFAWQNYLINGKFCYFSYAQIVQFSLLLLNLCCFFVSARVFNYYYLFR